jgi:uncharacterized OB-fold protein
MDDRTRAPAIEGWYTLDENEPHLLGSRCTACGTHYFPPRERFCSNPGCAGADGPAVLERVPLSRTGTLWSYTNACYQPPEPYISPDPFQPFAIAAVRLDEQSMIVLGQVTAGVPAEELRVGMRMEVVLETLYTDAQSARLVWKWKPMEGVA